MDAMVKEPARLGAGDVEVVIGDETFVLRPSYMAAKTISGSTGGIAGAMSRVVALDVDTIMMVLNVGCGFMGTKRPPKDFAEKVWATGFTDDTGRLAEHCVTYLRILAGGGRKPKGDEEGEEAVNPQN